MVPTSARHAARLAESSPDPSVVVVPHHMTMGFLRHLERQGARERRRARRRSVRQLRAILAALRGFALCALLSWLLSGEAKVRGAGLALTVLIASCSGAAVSFVYVWDEPRRIRKLWAREPRLRGWFRDNRVLRLPITPLHGDPGLQIPSSPATPRGGIHYDTPLGRDAPLTRRGRIELWVLSILSFVIAAWIVLRLL